MLGQRLLAVAEQRIRPGQQDGYDSMRGNAVAAASCEEGVLGYEWFRAGDDVAVVELFSGLEAFEAHAVSIRETTAGSEGVRERVGMSVLGDVSVEARDQLESSGVRVFEPLDGVYEDSPMSLEEVLIFGRAKVGQGRRDELREVVVALVAETVKDDGALVYSWFVRGEEVRVFERYANWEALETHWLLVREEIQRLFQLLPAPPSLTGYGQFSPEQVRRLDEARDANALQRWGGFRT